jgi:hypothetical protein
MDYFATLAMTDSFEIEYTTSTKHRHCEERSDEAIHFATMYNGGDVVVGVKNLSPPTIGESLPRTQD